MVILFVRNLGIARQPTSLCIAMQNGITVETLLVSRISLTMIYIYHLEIFDESRHIMIKYECLYYTF